MGINVREFHGTDRPQVRRLADRLTEAVAPWRDPHAVTGAVRSWIDESSGSEFDGTALVAIDDDGDVVGFLSLSTITHFGGEVDAYIGELVVAPHAERRGAGTELIGVAERRASADGLRCITLSTGAANERALRLYHRLGYRDEDIKLTKVLTEQVP